MILRIAVAKRGEPASMFFAQKYNVVVVTETVGSHECKIVCSDLGVFYEVLARVSGETLGHPHKKGILSVARSWEVTNTVWLSYDGGD